MSNVCESWGLSEVRAYCAWLCCGGCLDGKVRVHPFEAVEVVWELLGDRDGRGMYWERLWQDVGPEVAEWAEFLCNVELSSVGVPSFSYRGAFVALEWCEDMCLLNCSLL